MKKAGMCLTLLLATVHLVLCAGYGSADEQEKADNQPSRMSATTFRGLALRAIGPAQKSGRIADIVKDPNDPATWYVAVASGNVWRTVNNGTTWTPIFDDYGSYSIGCIAIDSRNPKILWLGTGENNSQRSVGYGDGVYKSLDAGESWTRVGLQTSEHIGKILIDPRDSDTVYVASQGPLWAPGGERGLYKTIDGGGTWERILNISENTGISDIAFDPRDANVIYATAYQRRRHVWTLVAGGPEGGIHKSTDGGKTWRRIVKGLPGTDLGRIGIAVSPIHPDVLYATVPAAWGKSGFYRSADGGENWVRMSDYITVDPQYYQELFPDPHRFDRVYCMDVMIHVTEDGGRTWSQVNSRFKHVDNHAMLFDERDPDYLMVGSDGGIYESWDRARTWRYIDNLPITQFYRVGIDDSRPFYYIYGGTQDNDSTGAPSRTTNIHGIRNSDWFITVGGDGYQVRVDPDNTDILYSMYQYGGLVRFDRRSGERIDIQPQPGKDDPPIRWNWDSPLILSPHKPTRLYFGSNMLFRSEDRGDSWQAVSPDLTRGIDRNRLEVMGTVWSVESVWKNVWTSFFGNMVALDESPLVEGLIYCGMDDGRINVTEDGGVTWRTIDRIPGVPDLTYVSDLKASNHVPDIVYAAFNNHKRGDFRPYLFKSEDRGKSWTPISGDMPDRHVTWTIQEDHIAPNLLFAGTEFGLFFTIDGGRHWVQLTGNVPTIPFRDLEIQKRENDLACATFGRGLFILDDYSPLRHVNEEALAREAILFPVKDAPLYIESGPLGYDEKAVLGDNFFTAPNPPFGAVFTFYLRDGFSSLRDQRMEQERLLQKAGKPVFYPDWESLRSEDREDVKTIVFVIRDEKGEIVRRLTGPSGRGFHRIAWDLRYPSPEPVRPITAKNEWRSSASGPLVMPGTYSVQMQLLENGKLQELSESVTFNAWSLALNSLEAQDRADLVVFQRQVADLQRGTVAMQITTRELLVRVRSVKQAVLETGRADSILLQRARAIEEQLYAVDQLLNGDRSVSSRFEPTPPSLADRVDRAVGSFWSTSAPTATHRAEYRIGCELYADLHERITATIIPALQAVEAELEIAGGPWTPSRPLPPPAG